MPFQKGNTLAAKDRRWTAAINRALERKSRKDGVDALERLADQFVAMVDEERELKGYQELGNRLEGSPAQRVELTGNDGAPLTIVVAKDDDAL